MIEKTPENRVDLSHGRRFRLPSTVLVLGVASFFTDFSSEMIYPLLPLFLSSVLGAGAMAIGIIEGIAEATASFVKLGSGWWTDRVRRRKPFVLFGYGMAGLVRPLIGLAPSWAFVLLLRFLDRVGKGFRASPRDAMITDVSPPQVRGRAFGFHRSMDHAGAVAGPLVAALLLSGAGLSIRAVFLLAAVPAAIVMVVLLLRLPEEKPQPRNVARPDPAPSSSPALRRFLVVLALFTLGNSTDAFLLLRLSDGGVRSGLIAVLWSAHHVVKMVSTYAGGRLSDRVGCRLPIQIGWFLYAGVYLFFAHSTSSVQMITAFLLYGLYYGLTEPAEKAWISFLAPSGSRGRGFGYYHAVLGFAALPASLSFGWMWKVWGPETAFTVGASLAFLAAVLLQIVRDDPAGTIPRTTRTTRMARTARTSI